MWSSVILSHYNDLSTFERERRREVTLPLIQQHNGIWLQCCSQQLYRRVKSHYRIRKTRAQDNINEIPPEQGQTELGEAMIRTCVD